MTAAEILLTVLTILTATTAILHAGITAAITAIQTAAHAQLLQ